METRSSESPQLTPGIFKKQIISFVAEENDEVFLKAPRLRPIELPPLTEDDESEI
jgi:hypothetical protein